MLTISSVRSVEVTNCYLVIKECVLHIRYIEHFLDDFFEHQLAIGLLRHAASIEPQIE